MIRLRTVSKCILLEGFNQFHSVSLALNSGMDQDISQIRVCTMNAMTEKEQEEKRRKRRGDGGVEGGGGGEEEEEKEEDGRDISHDS